MGTMEAMAWAMGLEGVPPESKLLAIYIASRFGMSRYVKVDVAKAAVFCGFFTFSGRPHTPASAAKRVQVALQAIPGVTFSIHDDGFVADLFNVVEGTVEP